MASLSHTTLKNLSPRLQSMALKIALKKGYTKDEADSLLAVRNNQGRIVDVSPNYSPF